MLRINAFDWKHEFPFIVKDGGFDAVVGNPPYIRIQTMKEWAPVEVEVYKKTYVSASKGNYDIYVVFVERGMSLLNASGRLSYILPHKFFNAQYGQPLRELLGCGQHLARVVHFGDRQVFSGATTYTCLLFLDKSPTDHCDIVKVDDLVAWHTTGQAAHDSIPTATIDSAVWNFSISRDTSLVQRLLQMSTKLKHVTRKIYQGLVTSADAVYLLDPLGPEQGGLVKVLSQATQKEYVLEASVAKPLCKGSRDVRRYTALPSKRVVFPYDVEASAISGKGVLIPASNFGIEYPRTWAYLQENYTLLRDREKGKMRHEGWYGYVYPKSISLFCKPKILTPSIASRASYTLDTQGVLYFVGSGGGGGGAYGIMPNDDCGLAYEYVLGLLNSKLVDLCLKRISSPFRGGYFAYNRQYLEELPIRSIDFSDKADKARHEKMVTLVERMLTLHEQLPQATTEHERRLLQRQITSTDQEIDQLVYALYGLTPDEIALVESAG